MATKRIRIPPHLGGSAFASGDRAFHGLSAARVLGDDLARPFHGVRSIGVDLTGVLGRCIAYGAIMLPGQRFTHLTAAALLGVPLPEHVDVGPLHVGVVAPRTPPRRRGVIGHKLSADSAGAEFVFGHPISQPADVWCQLATVLSPVDLVAAGDHLVTGKRERGRRLPPITTPEALTAAVARHRGRRGAGALEWALPRVRVGAESRPESLLRLLLVAAGLPEPLLNDPTPVAGGTFALSPDLKYPRERVIIEYEGDGHREKKRWTRDIERVELFQRAGWSVIRVTAEHLFDQPEQLVARIRRALSEAPRV